MDKGSRLISKINRFLDHNFGQENYFAIIYGSFVNGMRNKDSDIDLCVFLEKYTPHDVEELKQFIIDLHKDNNLLVDNEVPYENKLVASYCEAERAANLAGLGISGESVIVPPITKSPEFLSSSAVKLRLILNALTTPHIILGNDKKTWVKIKNMAEKNVTLLTLLWSDGKNVTIDSLFNLLIRGKLGEEGEMYLGYKRYPLIESYVKNWLQIQSETIKGSDTNEELTKLVNSVKKGSVA